MHCRVQQLLQQHRQPGSVVEIAGTASGCWPGPSLAQAKGAVDCASAHPLRADTAVSSAFSQRIQDPPITAPLASIQPYCLTWCSVMAKASGFFSRMKSRMGPARAWLMMKPVASGMAKSCAV
jgi:hypothetical protein